MNANETSHSSARQELGTIRRTPRDARLITAAVVVALAIAGAASAAEFNCPAGDVACLIGAINTANGNPDADTINLAAGNYTLTEANNQVDANNGLPAVTSSLTIRGAATNSTVIERDPSLVSPAPQDPLFRIIYVGVGGDLTLDQLTIQGGHVVNTFGGGLLNNGGAVTINNCIFRINRADYGGGVHILSGTLAINGSALISNASIFFQGGGFGSGHFEPGGTTIISSSVLADNQGSGVLNFGGNVTIENSTLARNAGGGIVNRGAMTVTGSAIFDNSVVTTGGGVHTFGGTLSITNSTIARNYAGSLGGGIYVGGGLVTTTNSTISGNIAGSLGAGLFAEGGPTGGIELQNTILAGNIGADCIGTDVVTSLGNNLIGSHDLVSCPLLPSDLTGDAGLHSFMDDGTPGNGHFPLLPGSQAIDAGNSAACLLTDQLGQTRFDGDNNGSVICDIGAIEFDGSTSPEEVIVNNLVTLNSVTTAFDPNQGPFTITARFTNTSAAAIDAPVFVVTQLTSPNYLLNGDGPPRDGIGQRLTPDVGSDGVLSPGEAFTVEFDIGLVRRAVFTFLVDLLGVPQP